jgi:sulfite exporter TauE/SafE
MLLTALTMGLAGSLHCAGMCSPLAIAIGQANAAGFRKRALYNLGRILTYGLLGIGAGMIGYVLPLARLQDPLSVILGIILLTMACSGVTGLRIPFLNNAVSRFTGMLRMMFAKFIQRKNAGAMLLLGSLNGLLPCGLTFLALSFSLTLGTPAEGFAFMFTFGIGTLPVMLGLVSLSGLLTKTLYGNARWVSTGLMIVSGMLLIARVFLVHLPDAHQLQPDPVDIVICR